MTDSNCIFCKIAGGEIPSATVYEDSEFRVILDLGPASRGHALILPKEHFKDLCELDEQALGCAGFNVVQNNGETAGQTVFHFHVHIIPRYEGGPAMVTWEPGKADSAEFAEISSSIKEVLQS